MYRFVTGNTGGVHNFVFHPTKPVGYASNGALPGLRNEIPIIDFRFPDDPKLILGPDTEGGVHDIEFSIDGNRAYAASENNYRIYDTTDPWRPRLISRTPNVGSYAHGVFPSPDLELMVTNNESLVLGGFLEEGTAVCPGEGLASYDIAGDNENQPIGPLGYYAPTVVGPVPDGRFCTSHFGRFAPGTKVMSIGWYAAGSRVVDWSNPANPVELAGAVLENANTWATKFYKGPYVYAGDIGRGFDVFRWSGDGPAPWVADGEATEPPAPSPSPTSEPSPSPSPTPEPQPPEPPADEPPGEEAGPPVEPGCAESWCRIQPGALLGNAESGSCTMGFVFRDNKTGRLLVSTAAHCTEKVGDRLHAEDEEESFQMQPDPFGTVAFRTEELDFALIEVDEGREGEVSASVRHWTGPTGIALANETAAGDEVLQFGYGFPFDSTNEVRARRGFLVGQNEREFQSDAPPGFGDSGAPVLHESGKALGLISRFNVLEAGVSTDIGPTVQGMLAFLQGKDWDAALLEADFSEQPLLSSVFERAGGLSVG
jgi:hypothetical protein